MNALPHDQAQRDRFIHETDGNFSVIASAGSGKTRGISDRIVAIARRADAVDILPCLVVVTFTQKSASELRDRARQGVLEANLPPQVVAAFSRAFFGTIHSFAVTLLRDYGHYRGIPAAITAMEEDDENWRAFLSSHHGAPSEMEPTTFRSLVSVYPYRSLLDLVRNLPANRPLPEPAGPMPTPDLRDVFAFPLPKRADTAANIRRHQEDFRRWSESISKGGEGFFPIPEPDTGGKDFLAVVAASTRSFRHWVARAAAEAATRLHGDYLSFRLARGLLTFDDQIALAAELTQHAEASREIRARGFRVILDEAQDTDPLQFRLLLGVAASPDESPAADYPTPRNGHFCMVGDPQQAIYGARADLPTYLRIQDFLVSRSALESLVFSVTFRCDTAVIDHVNAVCRNLLTGSGGQVAYVPLNPRPGAGVGQVLATPQVPLIDEDSVTDLQKAQHSAKHLARWLKDTGYSALGASGWEQVALICPRKDWFLPLRSALIEEGIPVTFQSTREVLGDNATFAWSAALATLWSEPRNSLECFGVLREVYGLSDGAIATFAEQKPERLSIVLGNPALSESGPIASALSELAHARSFFASLPIREAWDAATGAIRLRDRIFSLPETELVNVDSDWRTILTLASGAEARGESLHGFASELRVLMKKGSPTPDATPGSLPVITNLKSKGLQWDAVILPFFGRPISSAPASYPRFLPLGAPLPLVLSRADIPGEFATNVERADRHEWERILYVSLTRAKRSLVFADDLALWAGREGTASDRSLASIFRVDSDNKALWSSLLRKASLSCESKKPHLPAAQVTPLFGPELESAMAVATRFPRRILPHTLARDHVPASPIEDPEQRRASVGMDQIPVHLTTPGLAYGVWWHEMMETLPWKAGIDAWHSHAVAHLRSCPEPERGSAEWDLFARSSFANRLFEADMIYTELPFMAPLSSGDTLEGVVDLACRFRDGTWLVVDWKTNAGAAMDNLEERYLPQVRPYVDTLAAFTNAPVSGGIFSTSLGEFRALD